MSLVRQDRGLDVRRVRGPRHGPPHPHRGGQLRGLLRRAEEAGAGRAQEGGAGARGQDGQETGDHLAGQERRVIMMSVL